MGEGEGFSIAPLSSSQPKTGGPTVTAAAPALLQDTLASAHLRTFLSFTIQDHLTRGAGAGEGGFNPTARPHPLQGPAALFLGPLSITSRPFPSSWMDSAGRTP